MDRIVIEGGNRLQGQVQISGAKNASLPIMCAALLTDQPLTLCNLPHLSDITAMANLLTQHGVEMTMQAASNGDLPQVLTLQAKTIASHEAPYELVRRMRASYYVLGPLLARHGKARVSLPGGCAIGARPVDLHLQAMEALGATIHIENGYIEAEAPNGLTGGTIAFPMVTVGATAQALMAASLAKGTTTITNAAQEPEITDLANCLIAMGAKISGAGTSQIEIEGVSSLQAARHSICPDRIETGTYAIAAAITGGDLELVHTRLDLIPILQQKLKQAGATITPTDKGFRVQRDKSTPLQPVDIITEPFPGYPTDLQAQFLTLMTQAEGASSISETIFENRFMHVPELNRLGADIRITDHCAVVHGPTPLQGANVMATDLRASVSLVLAGLVAEGTTEILRVYHLDRGYERLVEKMSAVGANIHRVNPEQPDMATTQAAAAAGG